MPPEHAQRCTLAGFYPHDSGELEFQLMRLVGFARVVAELRDVPRSDVVSDLKQVLEASEFIADEMCDAIHHAHRAYHGPEEPSSADGDGHA